MSERVVELPSAGVPADQGLSSLGLLMQLAGTVLSLGVALVAFSALVVPDPRGDAMSVFLVLGTCVARSLFHHASGTGLLAGSLTWLRRYVIVGLAHSVAIVLALNWKFAVPGALAIGAGLALAVWPALLGALLVSKLRRFERSIPMSEDKGFEGASILMAVLGVVGALLAGTFLLALLDTSALRDGKVVLLMLGFVMLLVRAVIHVHAGISGLRTTSIDHSVELSNRYTSFGVISALCTGGAMLLLVLSVRLDVTSLAAVTCVTWMLMAWPLCIRRFFGERQFADLLAGEHADVHRRAPDAGLTALGWLLLAHASLVAAVSIVAPELPVELGRVVDAITGGLSPWWSIGIAMLEGWAGYHLIQMTRLHRWIAMLYAIVASIATAPVAISLVIPISTLILLDRKIAPSARARFRVRTA